jgi:hypothetical protein
MASLSAGDRVEIRSREVTPDDERNGLYYSYFGGLTGSVDTVYDDGSVCVNVDLESLSQDARDRHVAMQERERKKWLDSLSGEARNRLTPEQKQLRLSYKILVNKDDVVQTKGGKPNGKKSQSKSASDSSDASPAAHNGPARAPEPDVAAEEPAPKRVSEDDLSKAEEEYLRSLQQKGQ